MSLQLEIALQEKFRTGGFYQIRHAFKTFDATGHGAVSKEALFRIVVNLFPHTDQWKFKKLLERLRLDKKTAISFDEFYAQFRKQEPVQPKWLDPVSRHGPKFLTAFQVHQQLKEKARQRFMTIGSMFPSGKLDGRVMKTELKAILNQLTLPIEDDEFEKLWLRYDTEGRGVIQVEKLMSKLGIELKEEISGSHSVAFKKAAAGSSSSEFKKAPNGKAFQEENKVDIRDDGMDDVEKLIKSQLNSGLVRMRKAFEKIDIRRTGKVRNDEFRQVLAQFGIKLSPQECSDLLTRCGMNDSNLCNYRQFLHRFLDRSDGSLTNAILADPHHEFNKSDPTSTAVTASAAESYLMTLLQGNFLSLLGTFQAIDRAGTGVISQKDFRTVIEGHLKCSLTDDQFLALVRTVQLTSDGMLPYFDFLSNFDRGTTRAICTPPEFEGDQDEGRSMEEVCISSYLY
jgi:Ca2+-binding EF-hand superfamily protein